MRASVPFDWYSRSLELVNRARESRFLGSHVYFSWYWTTMCWHVAQMFTFPLNALAESDVPPPTYLVFRNRTSYDRYYPTTASYTLVTL
jgi:predicted membrane chloride channel (bestrophin family)